MSAPLLIGIFLFLVFAPCMVAFGESFGDSDVRDLDCQDNWLPMGEAHKPPVPCDWQELALAENLTIRSFPKGLSQRRLLVRDSDHGARLTIVQLRKAAAELIRLSGMAAAHEFALVVASTAAAMTSVRDAFAVAARRWLAWADAMAEQNHHRQLAWQKAPPKRDASARRWHEVLHPESQAA